MTTFPASGLRFVLPPCGEKEYCSCKTKSTVGATLFSFCRLVHNQNYVNYQVVFYTNEPGVKNKNKNKKIKKKIEHGIYMCMCYIWFTLPVRHNIKTTDGLNEYH